MRTDGGPGAGPPIPVVYVYYRVDSTNLAECVAAVRAAQALLMHRYPGLAATVLAKVPGRTTLMETYAWSPPLHPAALAAAPDWAAVEAEMGERTARWITGTRHVEMFEPCA